jgi:hypothetical protein
MGKTLKEIQSALPDLHSEKVKDISDELDRILAIKKLFNSEGGKELITVLRNNCTITLRKLIIKAKENPDLPSLLGLIAMYSANIDLLSTIQDISIEEELRKQLDEAVQEAYRLD